jgi:hypothetical protein
MVGLDCKDVIDPGVLCKIYKTHEKLQELQDFQGAKLQKARDSSNGGRRQLFSKLPSF